MTELVHDSILTEANTLLSRLLAQWRNVTGLITGQTASVEVKYCFSLVSCPGPRQSQIFSSYSYKYEQAFHRLLLPA
jgi:hypothetical protein